MSLSIKQIAQRRGQRAEVVAKLLLQLKGYRILRANFKTPKGEIDLIARRLSTLAFIEVKARANLSTAKSSLSSPQQQRIFQAAQLYMQRCRPKDVKQIRFDMIAVNRLYRPCHIQNAYDGSLFPSWLFI